MRSALSAAYFHTFHAVACVATVDDAILTMGLEKTRPAGAGIEFSPRVEQRIAATYATVNARLMAIPICAAEGGLRATLATHTILFRSE